ncbi:hypothetical protein ACA910_016990 [Epithemia clementina (nom. ined.)]
MSQQPCLPVGRRRKRAPNSGSKDGCWEKSNWENVSAMDATEYLQLVMSEASSLPDVFIAPPEEQQQQDDEEQLMAEKRCHEEDETNASTTALPLLLQTGNGSSATTTAVATGIHPFHSASAIKQESTGGNNNSKKKKHLSSPFLSGSAAALQYLVSKQTEMLPPPSNQHVPAAGKEWADRTLDAFSRLRLYLEQVKEANGGGAFEKKIALPPMKDRAAWHLFCVGKLDAEGNAGDYYDDDEDDMPDTSDNAAQESQVAAWEEGLLGQEAGHYWPTASLLLQMDQVMVRRVLSHLTYFVCEGWSLTAARSAWLYALATRLDRPVHRDDAVVIYKLVKRLTTLRAEWVPPPRHDTNAAAATTTTKSLDMQNHIHLLGRLNTLILIFAVYFEQGGGYAATMEPET